MDYEIIDFHTHPFLSAQTNICRYIDGIEITPEKAIQYLCGMGVSRICGSVLYADRAKTAEYSSVWEMIKENNRQALVLKELYGDFYIPGFHVHPGFVRESCEEIERMSRMGIKLIGELVPSRYGWSDYSQKSFDEILEAATHFNMVVSFHSMDEDQMDEMVKKHPDAILVAAHPGEYEKYIRHLNRMKMSENYYLDLSGTGLFRHRMLRRGIDECGVERFVFGSDYPICNPAMFIGGIMLDSLISPEEKKAIFSENTKRIFGMR